MSRSNPNEGARNPAERFFQWAGSTGKLNYYDKETKETVEVKLPFLFLVLDQLSTVTGYSDALKSGYWSNEVRSTQTDPLVVRSKAGVEFDGMYKDLDVKGAKFASSVYIAFKNDEGKLVLGNIKFSGAALSAWIEFAKKVNVFKYAVALTGSVSGKKGSVSFEKPTFQKVEVDEATDAAAVAIDKELQLYLETNLKLRAAQNHQVRATDYPEAEPAEPEITELPETPEPSEPAPANDAEQAVLDLKGIKF